MDGTAEYAILIEFSHKHLDFQIPELVSVLELNDIIIQVGGCNKEKNDKTKVVCRMLPLPNEDQYQRDTRAAPRRPFVLLTFPSEWYHQQGTDENKKSSNQDITQKITSLFSRCMLVRRVVEVWGQPGTTMEETAENTKLWIHQSTIGKGIYQQTCDPPTQTWKVTIHTLGAKYTRQEQDAMRSNFSFLRFPGPVQMKGPNHEFLLIREMELDTLGGPLYPRHGQNKVLIPENDKRSPLACYFGRILYIRENYDKYDLKQRAYLGPTSMDAELSFIMANLGQVQRSCVVLDPFVGTGSILVSCALRGAYVVGTDIDIRVLRGRNSEENIFSNFAQFQLPRPELIRSDNAIYHRHFRPNAKPWVDCIVTDPPYGIRAGAKKSGSRKDQPRPVLEENRHDHIAQTKPYCVADVMADLLDVAARVLVMGGRLVYVIPSFAINFDPKEDLPQHECLEIIHLSYQPFTKELGRRMVTMKKNKDYNPLLRNNYLMKAWKNGAESAEKCANIREKILEAAKQKPGYEEKAKIRKQKRIENKQAKKRAKLEQK